MRMLFFIGEGFAWRSSRPLSVYRIFFIIGGDIRARSRSSLLCSTGLFLQIINLLLHGLIIVPFRRYISLPSKTASICVDGMHTTFFIVLTISFMFKIKKLVLLTNISKLCLMQACLMWT